WRAARVRHTVREAEPIWNVLCTELVSRTRGSASSSNRSSALCITRLCLLRPSCSGHPPYGTSPRETSAALCRTEPQHSAHAGEDKAAVCGLSALALATPDPRHPPRRLAIPIMHLKTMKCNQFCLIASLADRDLFNRLEVRASFEALFRSFDSDTTFQYFKSFRRVRISFSDALAAAEARMRLHKSEFNGKEMRLYFAQSVHIGSPRLEPPKPDKQFLISPPASPPVGWEQVQDATPVINYDLLCAISKLGPGCDQESSGGEDEEGRRRIRPKIIQTRRPEYAPILH
ncbi:calcipressin-1-like, partial [Scleropages formosus]